MMNPRSIMTLQICALSIFIACSCSRFSQYGSVAQNSKIPAHPLFVSMEKKSNAERDNIFLQDSTFTILPNENFPPYCTYSPWIPSPPTSTVPSPKTYTPPSQPSPSFPTQSPPPRTPKQVPIPPYTAPSPPKSTPPRPKFAVWCVAKPTVPPAMLQVALDYACGSGADCEPIRRNGLCYQPDTVIAHASYAFNSYWQKSKLAGGTCDFGGTAMLVSGDPSYDECQFIYT